jgi:hypothetical protein
MGQEAPIDPVPGTGHCIRYGEIMDAGINAVGNIRKDGE